MEPETAPPTPAVPPLESPWRGRAPMLLCAALVGLVAAQLLGRSLRDPPVVVSLVVTFLPYLYAGLAVAAGLGALVGPRRRGSIAVGSAAVGILLGSWGPRPRPEPVPGVALRVLEWNVQRLWGTPRTADASACVTAAIEREDPDAVVLLEVSAADVAALGPRLGLTCAHSDYLGSGRPTHGGLAICTRGPTWTLRSGGPRRYRDDSRWRYVFGEIESGGRVVNLMAVHLVPYRFAVSELKVDDLGDLVDLGRRGGSVVRAQGAQAAVLGRRFEDLQDPTIVAGDFNSTRDAALHTSLRASLTDTFAQVGRTFGATVRFLDVVPLRVDYVYATDDVVPVDAVVLEDPCSDHRAVRVDLTVRTY